ncbi:multidrug ABC transporter permease/ATP-binding protein [Pedobacter psychrotolerans]|uniref:Multidrug ABC transporter permease/ATP-binding protein n=3 Tax=Pedobacter psychrotolerans TaxID=1843235 RepID=A0ABQ1SPA1_9SPHI|nr:multidrug ABC transporter permease/ATP-binding protein [Pedobacter psychrotolerans]
MVNYIVSGKMLAIYGNLDIYFFSLVIFSFLLNIFFQKKIIVFSNKLIYESELHIMENFQKASMHHLEEIGLQRIYSIIEDLRVLVFLPGIINTAITSLMTLFICLIYFLVVSLPSAIFIITLIMVISSVYYAVNIKVKHSMDRLKELNNSYFAIVDDILKGFREFKLSMIRRTGIRENYLRPNRLSVNKIETRVSGLMSVINLFSQYGLYLLIGIVIFILPRTGMLNKQEVTTFVIILLFIRGPINSLMALQGFFNRAFVANKRIATFLKDIKDLPVSNVAESLTTHPEGLNEIVFDQVSYQYKSALSGDGFAIKEINLTIKKGEFIFVIGGNGSGKSTFINLLTGIYHPTSGNIFFNGKRVGNDSQYYRNHISAVYSEPHLFSANYEGYKLENNAVYKALLETMELDTVVSGIDDAAARRKFSKGQTKRMAMIFALLEERPILVLDEWAADQDPHFRKYFYEEMLIKLREQGKTIIAVTHDDAYFKHADRIIKFDYGQVVKDIDLKSHSLEADELWNIPVNL